MRETANNCKKFEVNILFFFCREISLSTVTRTSVYLFFSYMFFKKCIHIEIKEKENQDKKKGDGRQKEENVNITGKGKEAEDDENTDI